MSRLSNLIAQAREGLSFAESTPQDRWEAIAFQCGPEEIAEIEHRIAALRRELREVEEWDGDTQDDINIAIYQFSQLLKRAVGAH